MKKSLIFCGLAALSLASCTKSEVLDVNENRTIGFDGFVGKPSRVASEITNENFTSFQVFGGFGESYTNVYNDVAVNKGDGTNWTATETKYWQKNKTYTFNAYASTGNGTTSVGVNGVSISGFEADGNTDLLIANTETVNTGSSGFDISSPSKVQFTFNHVLSMIKFTFSTDLQDVNITISDLQVNGVPSKANYTASAENSGTWNTIESYTKNYQLSVSGSISNGEGGAKSSTEAIVIPQTANSLTVSFKLKATGALDIEDTQARVVNLPSTEWVKGQRYNYTANITAANIDPDGELKPIEFATPKEEPWGDYTNGGSIDINK